MTGVVVRARFRTWCQARRCHGREILRGQEFVQTPKSRYHTLCVPESVKVADTASAAIAAPPPRTSDVASSAARRRMDLGDPWERRRDLE